MGETSVNTDLPSSNFTALLDNGAIPDPFYRDNEKKSLYISKNDCSYEKSFNLDFDKDNFDKIILRFERIDCLSEVIFNGETIAETKNAHVFYEFDSTSKVKKGENTILVKLFSPLNFIEKRQAENPMPNNPNGFNGACYIRKPGCNFGWDWGIGLPPSGLENVSIIGYSKIKLNSFDVHQEHFDGKVRLSFSADFESYSADASLFVEINDGEKTAKVPFEDSYLIENPVLWWSNGMNGAKKQKLYCIKLIAEDNGKELDSISKKIGLRTIYLDRSPDNKGENFCFVLNGVKIFAKGANWIPIDAFITRRTKDDYRYYIESAANANMNMLRVWGGGYYGSEDFYDLCDEYGILVWQDFPFACMPYPFYEKEFFDNVIFEVQQNIVRLRNRTSLALFCGNNEIEQMTGMWAARRELVKWTELFFYRALKGEVDRLAPGVSYIPGSPVGKSYLNKIASDDYGDTHLWHVWHGLRDLTYYRKRLTRFCSELGLESLPSMTAIRSFAEESDFSLDSEIFNAHQKCVGGNKKILYYLLSRYNLPVNFADYVYLSNLTQKTCVTDAAEHWLRNSGRCNGILYWQLNDNWPVSSWSSIDYTGKFKALQYGIRHSYAPVSVSLENNKSLVDVYLINHTLEDKQVTLKCGLVTFSGETKYFEESEITLEKTSVTKIKTHNCAHYASKGLKDCVFYAYIVENGKEINKKTVLFTKDRKLKLEEGAVSYTVEKNGNKTVIKLKARSFARSVQLDYAGTAPFSDNYFDLLPNEEKVVEIADSIDDLQVKSLADVPFDKSVIKRLSMQLSIILDVKIFAMAIAYLFV